MQRININSDKGRIEMVGDCHLQGDSMWVDTCATFESDLIRLVINNKGWFYNRNNASLCIPLTSLECIENVDSNEFSFEIKESK